MRNRERLHLPMKRTLNKPYTQLLKGKKLILSDLTDLDRCDPFAIPFKQGAPPSGLRSLGLTTNASEMRAPRLCYFRLSPHDD